MNETNQIIEQLFPRIQRAAGRVFSEQIVPMVEKDDIAQAMALRALERARNIPGFAEQKPAYIMTDIVQNGGKRLCEKERTYSRYVAPDSPLTNEDENGPEPEMLIQDRSISLETDPENAVTQGEFITHLISRIKEMTPECQQVIALAMKGLNDADIARELNVTRSAISHRRETARKHLGTIAFDFVP